MDCKVSSKDESSSQVPRESETASASPLDNNCEPHGDDEMHVNGLEKDDHQEKVTTIDQDVSAPPLYCQVTSKGPPPPYSPLPANGDTVIAGQQQPGYPIHLQPTTPQVISIPRDDRRARRRVSLSFETIESSP